MGTYVCSSGPQIELLENHESFFEHLLCLCQERLNQADYDFMLLDFQPVCSAHFELGSLQVLATAAYFSSDSLWSDTQS